MAGWGQLVLVPNMGTPWYPSWGRPLPVVAVLERCKPLGAWFTPGWGRHQGHREWDHWEHPAGGADTRRPQKSREAESSHQARLFCQGLIRLVTGREEPARFPPLIPPESFLSAVPALKKKAVKMTALGCLAQKGSFPRIQPGPKSPVLVEAEGRGASWLTQSSS